MYLELFNVVLDLCDCVAIDVVANFNFLSSNYFCPDNCKKTKTHCVLKTLHRKQSRTLLSSSNPTDAGSVCISSRPCPGVARRTWPQHNAVAWICGVLHVPGAGKTEARDRFISGRNVCSLLPGSWPGAGGSQSAVFKKLN